MTTKLNGFYANTCHGNFTRVRIEGTENLTNMFLRVFSFGIRYFYSVSKSIGIHCRFAINCYFYVFITGVTCNGNFYGFNAEVIGQLVTTFQRTTGFSQHIQILDRSCNGVPAIGYFFTNRLISDFTIAAIIENIRNVVLVALYVFQELTFVSNLDVGFVSYYSLQYVFEVHCQVFFFQNRQGQSYDRY